MFLEVSPLIDNNLALYINKDIIAEWKDILFHPSILKSKNSFYNKVFWGNFIAFLDEGDIDQNSKKLFLEYCLEADNACTLFKNNNEQWKSFCDFVDSFVEFSQKDPCHMAKTASYLPILEEIVKISNLYQYHIDNDDINKKIICIMLCKMMDSDMDSCMSDPDILQEAYAIIAS